MITNDLRTLIDIRLNSIKTEYGIKDIGYRLGSDQKLFPSIVWDITTTQPTDMGRMDYLLDFHVWGRTEIVCFDIMDAIRDLMTFRNDPQDNFLPTFYEQSGGTVDDPDRSLVHCVLRMQAQVYDRTATDRSILGIEKE